MKAFNKKRKIKHTTKLKYKMNEYSTKAESLFVKRISTTFKDKTIMFHATPKYATSIFI